MTTTFSSSFEAPGLGNAGASPSLATPVAAGVACAIRTGSSDGADTASVWVRDVGTARENVGCGGGTGAGAGRTTMDPSFMISAARPVPSRARAIASDPENSPDSEAAVRPLTTRGSNSTEAPVCRAIARRESDKGCRGCSTR